MFSGKRQDLFDVAGVNERSDGKHDQITEARRDRRKRDVGMMRRNAAETYFPALTQEANCSMPPPGAAIFCQSSVVLTPWNTKQWIIVSPVFFRLASTCGTNGSW